LAIAALLALTLPGPAWGESQDERPAAPPAARGQAELETSFPDGYQAFEREDYARAAGLFLDYLNTRTRDDERYEWAQFFLGISFHELGYSHGAVDTLSSLVVQKPNARIVSYSLELLEQITRTRPFDREQVLLDVLCEQEYGFVDPALTEFVNYYQGLYAWELGYVEWGNDHFRRLRPETYYQRKYRYQKALYLIYQDQLEPAAALLERLTEDPRTEPALRDEARVTLARVRYEQQVWPEAERNYGELGLPEQEQARYLLERAWVQFRMDNPEQAMGLLYAFEAPSFWRFFTPEYYLLKSLIYKDVCQYREALAVVGEFNGKYREALAFIRERGAVTDNDALLLALLEKPEIRRLYRFMGLLQEESAGIDTLTDERLASHLRRIYALQEEQTRRQLRKALEDEYERMAADLLGYQEQVHLLEYEIGLDMYQRVADYHFTGEPPAARAAGEPPAAVFTFQGEFWNDELDDYRVVLEDRCESAQEWDIFFQ
jgi:hypothetical protein